MRTRLAGSSMALDSKRSEILRTYGDVMNSLPRSLAKDEVIAKAYNDVTSFAKALQ